MNKILITGSAGLIGVPLVRAMRRQGWEVAGLDLRADLDKEQGDIRDRDRVRRSLLGCVGVIHLAAVARVLDAQTDPERCRTTNITGARIVADEAVRQPSCRWLLFASSREVYGQPGVLPVTELSPLQPQSQYGRSKLRGEQIVRRAQDNGLAVGVARITNTYGSRDDHPDRVIPAFARAAAAGEALRVEGPDRSFDFLHVEDTVAGLVAMAERLADTRRSLPTLQLVSGESVSLGALARLCVSVAGTGAPVELAPPRDAHVAAFVGDPGMARETLGWSPSVQIRDGVERLIADFADELQGTTARRSAS